VDVVQALISKYDTTTSLLEPAEAWADRQRCGIVHYYIDTEGIQAVLMSGEGAGNSVDSVVSQATAVD
jgi:hypothetical protein